MILEFRSLTATALFSIVTVLSAANALAQDKDVPNPGQWVKDLESNGQLSGEYPRKMIFVTSLGDTAEKKPKKKDKPKKGKNKKDEADVAAINEEAGIEFLDVDSVAFNKLGFFQTVDSDSIGWSLKLNQEAFKDKDPIEVLLNISKADTLVLAPKGGKWQFIRMKAKKRQIILSVKGPKGTKPDQIVAWLPQVLGWDGVVLGKKEEFVLVGSTTQILTQPQIQALVVKDSAAKFVLPKNRKGAGLLSLNEFSGGFGIFDVVFLGQEASDLLTGSKLIIEKKK